ncbi:alpha-D-glucose phosphate-specific phosphoglucomutase [Desulfitispora alkaliphila]|uniref:phosphoglucomutase/phosphomannomutase family protein n=1 Tax=Desulfitispora alkaliphila TaxID=622674 RepID=UPI003D248563
MTIKFGTDGWRAIMAQDFTFGNVEIVVQAVANYLIAEGLKDKEIVVGYDNRFLSPEFAQRAVEVLAGNGIKTLLGAKAMPTPVTAFAIAHNKAGGALMFTASHNPSMYNGIKFIPHYAGPALPEVTDKIEKQVSAVTEKREINGLDYDEAVAKVMVTEIDPKAEYFAQIKTLLDIEVISQAKLKLAIDPMYGAGVGYMEELAADLGCEVEAINSYRDPLFGGKMPEPSAKVLTELTKMMETGKYDLGLALDGDADRFGIITANGRYVTPNQVISLLYIHLLKKGITGSVTKTVSTTQLLNRIAERNGYEALETPVGFKYIGQNLMEKGCAIGGEESGGLSIKGHVPEKDGILACLLIVELVAATGKGLEQLIAEMDSEFGLLVNRRLDIECKPSEKERVLKKLESWRPDTIARKPVVEVITVDGIKFVLEDGSWVLVRASGTEPLFRIYGETETVEDLDTLQDAVKLELGL